MSVLARMRKLSQYEFYVNALRLRKSMRFLLLRDLGIKDKVREIREFSKDMSEEDKAEFIRLAAERQITLKDFQTQYKSWRGDKKRYNAYYTLCKLDSEERKLISWIRATHSMPMA